MGSSAANAKPWLIGSTRRRPHPEADSLKHYPGMANVCLSHAMAYRADGNTAWRKGGTDRCMCELASDAIVRLRAQAEWARQDAADCIATAEECEAEIARLVADRPPEMTADSREANQ